MRRSGGATPAPRARAAASRRRRRLPRPVSSAGRLPSACAAGTWRPSRVARAATSLSSSGFLSCLGDQLGDPFQVLVGQPGSLAAEDGGHDLFGGSVEEGLDEVFQCGLSSGVPWNGGDIDIAEPFLLVA